jgi:DNA-binding transcriptional ArsR family regulator
MSEDGLDPVIHAPARLRIAVTLAALPDGDNLSFTKLQDLIGLTPGNLITHLRKLEDAGSGVLGRLAFATPRAGQWEQSLRALQLQAQRALDSLSADPAMRMSRSQPRHR